MSISTSRMIDTGTVKVNPRVSMGKVVYCREVYMFGRYYSRNYGGGRNIEYVEVDQELFQFPRTH